MDSMNELDRWINGQMDGWINGWMDKWMDGWINGWMDGWTERWIITQHIFTNGLLFKYLWQTSAP